MCIQVIVFPWYSRNSLSPDRRTNSQVRNPIKLPTFHPPTPCEEMNLFQFKWVDSLWRRKKLTTNEKNTIFSMTPEFDINSSSNYITGYIPWCDMSCFEWGNRHAASVFGEGTNNLFAFIARLSHGGMYIVTGYICLYLMRPSSRIYQNKIHNHAHIYTAESIHIFLQADVTLTVSIRMYGAPFTNVV